MAQFKKFLVGVLTLISLLILSGDEQNLYNSFSLLLYSGVLILFIYREKFLKKYLSPDLNPTVNSKFNYTKRDYYFYYFSGLFVSTLSFAAIGMTAFVNQKPPTFGSYGDSLFIILILLTCHIVSIPIYKYTDKAFLSDISKTNYKKIGFLIGFLLLLLFNEQLHLIIVEAILYIILPFILFPLLSVFVLLGWISYLHISNLGKNQLRDVSFVKKLQLSNAFLFLFCFSFFFVKSVKISATDYNLQMSHEVIQDKSNAGFWLGIFKKPLNPRRILPLLSTQDPSMALIILSDYRFRILKNGTGIVTDDPHIPLSRVAEVVTSGPVFAVYLSILDRSTLQERHLPILMKKLTQFGLKFQSKIGKQYFCDQLVKRSQQNQMMENYFNTQNIGQYVLLEGLLGVQYKSLSQKLSTLKNGRAPASLNARLCTQL